MKINTSRTETFSDSVMAIVITIMTLALFPEITGETSDRDLFLLLEKLLPRFIAYILSFVMIGIFWINHHHMFHLLEKTDEPLLFQNLHFLFWLSLIPMATEILGTRPFLSYSSVVYGFVMLMTTLAFTIMRIHASKKGLVHTDENPALTRKIQKLSIKAKTKSMIGTAAYLLSLPLALVSVYGSFLCFIIPPIIFFIPDGIDDDVLAEKIAKKN